MTGTAPIEHILLSQRSSNKITDQNLDYPVFVSTDLFVVFVVVKEMNFVSGDVDL